MGSRVDIKELGDQLFDDLQKCRDEIHQSRDLLRRSKKNLKDYLQSINGDCDAQNPSLLEIQYHHVVREKAIYTCINQMQKRDKLDTYIGFFWAPVKIEE